MTEFKDRKRLIINADDFGLTAGINRAVIECFQRGAVTSTTLMVNAGAARDAAALAATNRGLGVGLHLNLTAGAPTLPPEKVTSLVGANGKFPGLQQMLVRLTLGRARTGELEAEVLAQIERCRELGVEPTHVDSHHHLHAHPRLRGILAWACRRAGIKKARGYRMAMRSPKAAAIRLASLIPVGGDALLTPNRFSGIEAMGDRDMATALAAELSSTRGVLEFMCHPGHADADLASVSTYSDQRQVELIALLAGEWLAAIESAAAEPISYCEL
ncbi:MAG: carbohydrate deacetylase [Thermoleophilia bacterium]